MDKEVVLVLCALVGFIALLVLVSQGDAVTKQNEANPPANSPAGRRLAEEAANLKSQIDELETERRKLNSALHSDRLKVLAGQLIDQVDHQILLNSLPDDARAEIAEKIDAIKAADEAKLREAVNGKDSGTAERLKQRDELKLSIANLEAEIASTEADFRHYEQKMKEIGG